MTGRDAPASAAGRGLRVSGGAGGLAVALDDLSRAAAALAGEAEAVAAQGVRLLGALPGADVVVAGVATALRRSLLADPVRPPDPSVLAALSRALARAEAAAARALGVDGAGGQAVLLAALAASVRGAVAAYRAGERLAEALVGSVEYAAVGSATRLAPVLAVGAAGTAALAAVDPTVRDDLEAVLFAHPWLVDAVAGGLRGAVTPSTLTDPRLAWLLAWACAVEGRPYPPRSQAEAVGALESVGHLVGALDEEATVPSVVELPPPAAAPLPDCLSGLVAGQVDLGRPEAEATVRVIEVPRADGGSAWVVEIPGTQRWWPDPGENPFDATTDVAAMAGEATVAARGVAMALDAAMRTSPRATSSDPVLLSGHSQGGILAAALASDPGFLRRHRVTHVVTSGSPIARFPIPADVAVLSLENAQDPVPRLDGATNPDRMSWTTVTRDLSGDPDSGGHPFAGHAATEYAETAAAVDALRAGRSASVDAWRTGAAPFLAGDRQGEVVVRDYRVPRLPAASATALRDGWQNARP